MNAAVKIEQGLAAGKIILGLSEEAYETGRIGDIALAFGVRVIDVIHELRSYLVEVPEGKEMIVLRKLLDARDEYGILVVHLNQLLDFS